MSEFELARLLRPELAELRAYLPNLARYEVRLDANEAPSVFPEWARARLAAVAGETCWERYPDPTARELRAAIAARCGVSPEEVVVGVGSDEVISMLLTAFCRAQGRGPAAIVTTTPTFVMYRLSARVRGMQVVEVPLDDDWDLSTSSMLRAIEVSEPNLIFVASPNNPTGRMMSSDRLERVIESARGALVVIDEAYVDYSSQHQLAIFREHGNVAVLRTLSKVGFAALRLGWVIARRELISELDKVRQPYNVPALSQRLGTVVLNELRHELESVVRYVVAERERISAELGSLPGVSLARSDANFLWLRTAKPASEVFEHLCGRSVLVRSFSEHGGRLVHHLRVTIGTRAENDRFVAALREGLAQ